MDVQNKINMILGENRFKADTGWQYKGNDSYTHEWYNQNLNKTVVVQHNTSRKYVAQLFNGGERVMSFNKFLSGNVGLTEATNAAKYWMFKNR